MSSNSNNSIVNLRTDPAATRQTRMSPPPSITSTSAPSYPLSHQASSGYNPGRKLWESWPEAVRVLARGRARGIFPGPMNVALLALELVSPSRSLPVDSLSRSSEGGSEGTQSRAPFPCMPDTPAVLSSVVVCGRLTLLSFSKILLLNHDPWAG